MSDNILTDNIYVLLLRAASFYSQHDYIIASSSSSALLADGNPFN